MRNSAIDTMRGVAVMLMVVAHTTDAFLDPIFKNGDVWHGVDLLFGYVAPAFLFLSGVVLRIALERNLEKQQKGRRIRQLFMRLLRLFLLGYWLQIPVLSLHRLLESPSPPLLLRLFDTNILQIIAVSGALAILLYVGISGGEKISNDGRIRVKERWFGWATLLAALAFTVATPWVWSSPSITASLPLPLAPYFSPQPVATFPLFPYTAYYLFGLLAARWLLHSSGSVSRAVTVAGAGAIVTVTGLLLDIPLHQVPPHNDFWGSSVQHVIVRLGGVLVLVAVGLGIDMIRGRLHELLCSIGRMSLAIYLLHLILIYGSPMTMGMRYWFGGALAGAFTPMGAIGLSIGIIFLVSAAVVCWKYLRQKRPAVTLWTKRVAWGAFWGFFLLMP